MASVKSSAFLFFLFVKEDFVPHEADIFFWVEVRAPGRTGKCNNVHEALGVPWKKIQGISLINAGLPIPLNSENSFKQLLHEETSRKARLMYFFTWQLPHSNGP